VRLAVLLKASGEKLAYDHEMDTTFMASVPARRATVTSHFVLDKEAKHLRPVRAEPETPHAPTRSAVCWNLPAQMASVSTVNSSVASVHSSRAELAVLGIDNRTVAVRCQPVRPSRANRARVAGGRRHPYLLMPLCAGITRSDQQDRPGAPVEGNSYEQNEQTCEQPARALRELDDSESWAKYIGPAYIDVFVACKESELASRNSILTLSTLVLHHGLKTNPTPEVDLLAMRPVVDSLLTVTALASRLTPTVDRVTRF